jgi:hypothetical protein
MKMTLRDLYDLTTAARGHWVVCGTPTVIAHTLEERFLSGAADGFNIRPPYFPGAFADFVDHVVPELQRRGLYRRDYQRMTLRNHLGLACTSDHIAGCQGSRRSRSVRTHLCYQPAGFHRRSI